MEPTMAPMMMLVTVIPETEEESGAKSVLNRCTSLVLSFTQPHEGIHKPQTGCSGTRHSAGEEFKEKKGGRKWG